MPSRKIALAWSTISLLLILASAALTTGSVKAEDTSLSLEDCRKLGQQLNAPLENMSTVSSYMPAPACTYWDKAQAGTLTLPEGYTAYMGITGSPQVVAIGPGEIPPEIHVGYMLIMQTELYPGYRGQWATGIPYLSRTTPLIEGASWTKIGLPAPGMARIP